MDILEKILQWLRPRDLALLSLTCKTLNFVVRNYVTHECEKSTLSPQLKRFFEQNKELLLPKEVALLEAVKVNPKPELLLYSTGKQYLGKLCSFKILSNCRLHAFQIYGSVVVVNVQQHIKQP